MNKGKLSIRGLIHGLRESDTGTALVELGVAVPIFTMLLLGSAELARVAYASIEVTNAAKAAVQYGAQTSATAADATGIKLAATNEAYNLNGLSTTVSTSCICSDGSASTCLNTDCSSSQIEQILTVQTQETFDPLIHAPGLPTSYTIHGRAIQNVLQ
jgi:Flp pilus assembly protein TadG